MWFLTYNGNFWHCIILHRIHRDLVKNLTLIGVSWHRFFCLFFTENIFLKSTILYNSKFLWEKWFTYARDSKNLENLENVKSGLRKKPDPEIFLVISCLIHFFPNKSKYIFLKIEINNHIRMYLGNVREHRWGSNLSPDPCAYYSNVTA